MRQLTVGGKSRHPIWSRDSQWVAFESDREGDLGVFRQRADGSGVAERLTKPEGGTEHVPQSWSKDGGQLLFSVSKGKVWALWTLSVKDGRVAPFGDVHSIEPAEGAFSPDGQWVAYALDADLQRRRGRGTEAGVRPGAPGRRRVLGGQGHPEDGAPRAVHGPGGAARERPGGLALRRPLRRPAGRRGGVRGDRGPARRPTSIASSPGTRSARTRAPASSTSRRAAAPRTSRWARRLGLPVIAPLDESGHYLEGFGHLRGLDAPGVAARIVEDLEAQRLLLPPRAVHAPLPALLALRHAAALPRRGRVVHLDGPACTTCPASRSRAEQKAAQPALPDHGRRRHHPLDPGFGYERELDWLRTMSDWIDLEEALLGSGAAHLGVRRLRRLRRHRRARGARRRAVGGLGAARGPHAAPSLRRRGPDRLPVLRRGRASASGTWAIPGSTPASCRSPRSTTARTRATGRSWFPADFITESFPGQFRNWFYSMLAMSTVLRREPPFRTIFGYATLVRRGRPADAQVAGATPSSSTRRPSAWASTSCAGCTRASGRRTTSCSATTPRTRRVASCSSCGTCSPSSARSAASAAGGRVPASLRCGSPSASGATALDRWILSRAPGWRRRPGPPWPTTTRGPRRVAISDLHRRPVARGACGAAGAASRAATTRATATPPSGRCTSRSARRADRRADPAVPGRGALPGPGGTQVDETRPTPSTSPAGPTRSWRGLRDAVARGGDGGPAPGRRAGRTLRGAAGLRVRQPLAHLWLALPGGRPRRRARGAATSDELLALLADELNVRAVELIGDESELVERRVKPLLPVIGRRLGARIPAIMAAARANEVEYLPDGGGASWRARSWRPTRSRSWPRPARAPRSPTTRASWSSSTRP